MKETPHKVKNVQEQKLLTRLNATKDARKRIDLLLELADLYFRTDEKKRLAYGEQAYRLSEGIDDSSRRAKSLYHIADANFCLGEVDRSLEIYRTALEKYQEVENRELLLVGISYPLRSKGQFDRALVALTESLDIVEQLADKKGIKRSLYLIGVCYYYLANYVRAFDYVSQSLSLAQELDDSEGWLAALNQLALIYSETGEKEYAIQTFLELLTECRRQGDSYRESISLGNLGAEYHALSQNESSLRCYTESLKLQEALENTIFQIYSHCNIAGVLCDLNRIEEAVASITEAMRLFHSTGYQEHAHIAVYCHYARIMTLYGHHTESIKYGLEILPYLRDGKAQEMHRGLLERMIMSYEALEDYPKAFEFQKSLHELEKRIVRAEMDRDLKRKEFRLEIERKEAEKEAYRLRALKLEDELKQQAQYVAKLALEVIERNEFLTSMKKRVQGLVPNANGDLKVLRSFVKEIDEKLASSEAQQKFELALKELHDRFLLIIEARYPGFTNMEKKVCSLIKLGLNTQQIADLLFTSVRTIEGHRLNIRKKLSLDASKDLAVFFEQF